MTYQSSEDEEDHEESTNWTDADDVAVADSRHGDQSEIDALPVGGGTVAVALQVRKRVLDLRQPLDTILRRYSGALRQLQTKRQC